jgi:hypothetical protein
MTKKHDQPKETVSLSDICLANNKLCSQHAAEFRRIFGIQLKPYFNPITGFDIVKFDADVVKSTNDESVYDAVRRCFGQAGADLCEKLLGQTVGNEEE